MLMMPKARSLEMVDHDGGAGHSYVWASLIFTGSFSVETTEPLETSGEEFVKSKGLRLHKEIGHVGAHAAMMAGFSEIW